MVTQLMALFPVLTVALLLVVSFVALRVWLEHRRYDEFVRVLEKQPVKDPVHAIAAIQGGRAHRPTQSRVYAERGAGSRRTASARTRRFRVVEN